MGEQVYPRSQIPAAAVVAAQMATAQTEGILPRKVTSSTREAAVAVRAEARPDRMRPQLQAQPQMAATITRDQAVVREARKEVPVTMRARA